MLSGELSKEAANRKYGIRGHSTISKWIAKLGGHTKSTSISMDKSTQESQSTKIRELEQELAYERMKSRAYEEMMALVEEQLQMNIRKKSNTKQSKR